MKVVIIGGAGGVGSSVAFNLLIRDEPYDVVLVDSNPNLLTSHVMDLEQTLALGASCSVRCGTEFDVIDSDIVVVCASVPLRLNNSRSVFLRDNTPIIVRISNLLANKGSTWGGILLIVTNPVDPFCTWAQQYTGIDRRRILGYTLNDTLRLRTGISQVLSKNPKSIDAWVIGEHGDYCVPLFSRVMVDGVSINLSDQECIKAEEFMRTWYVSHVGLGSGRTTTWTTGLGVSSMVSAIGNGKNELWPASIVLTGEYGIKGVSLSVPVSLGYNGANYIHEWTLEKKEMSALTKAATYVRDATNSINSLVDT